MWHPCFHIFFFSDKELQAIVIEDYETQTLANNLQISLAFRRTNALEIMRVMRNTHINYEEQQLLTGLSVALKNQGIYNRTQHIDNILQVLFHYCKNTYYCVTPYHIQTFAKHNYILSSTDISWNVTRNTLTE